MYIDYVQLQPFMQGPWTYRSFSVCRRPETNPKNLSFVFCVIQKGESIQSRYHNLSSLSLACMGWFRPTSLSALRTVILCTDTCWSWIQCLFYSKAQFPCTVDMHKTVVVVPELGSWCGTLVLLRTALPWGLDDGGVTSQQVRCKKCLCSTSSPTVLLPFGLQGEPLSCVRQILDQRTPWCNLKFPTVKTKIQRLEPKLLRLLSLQQNSSSKTKLLHCRNERTSGSKVMATYVSFPPFFFYSQTVIL